MLKEHGYEYVPCGFNIHYIVFHYNWLSCPPPLHHLTPLLSSFQTVCDWYTPQPPIIVKNTPPVYGFYMIFRTNSDYLPKRNSSVLILVMETRCIFFEVRT
jgi:hypothetical protein